MVYQWLHNNGGVPLADNSHISGLRSNILTVACALSGDAGNYRLLVTNTFGDTASADAAVTIVPQLTLADGSAWTLNGRAAIASDVLTLTAGTNDESVVLAII